MMNYFNKPPGVNPGFNMGRPQMGGQFPGNGFGRPPMGGFNPGMPGNGAGQPLMWGGRPPGQPGFSNGMPPMGGPLPPYQGGGAVGMPVPPMNGMPDFSNAQPMPMPTPGPGSAPPGLSRPDFQRPPGAVGNGLPGRGNGFGQQPNWMPQGGRFYR